MAFVVLYDARVLYPAPTAPAPIWNFVVGGMPNSTPISEASPDEPRHHDHRTTAAARRSRLGRQSGIASFSNR